MLDLRTLWLAHPEDRYEASETVRAAERLVYPMMREGRKVLPLTPRNPHSMSSRVAGREGVFR